jgi:hypothetical protein
MSESLSLEGQSDLDENTQKKEKSHTSGQFHQRSTDSFKSQQGPHSQNFSRQILKIFVTLGINILRFYKP